MNINETTNYWENHLPFGGRAGTDSGSGRVGGRYPFEVLTELQTVVIGPELRSGTRRDRLGYDRPG